MLSRLLAKDKRERGLAITLVLLPRLMKLLGTNKTFVPGWTDALHLDLLQMEFWDKKSWIESVGTKVKRYLRVKCYPTFLLKACKCNFELRIIWIFFILIAISDPLPYHYWSLASARVSLLRPSEPFMPFSGSNMTSYWNERPRTYSVDWGL